MSPSRQTGWPSSTESIDEKVRPAASTTVTPPTWSFATAPAVLGPADRSRYRYAVESECEVPTPGATASVLLPLEPEAWFASEHFSEATPSGTAEYLAVVHSYDAPAAYNPPPGLPDDISLIEFRRMVWDPDGFAFTLLGPPDRISPTGCLARIVSSGVLNGRISE